MTTTKENEMARWGWDGNTGYGIATMKKVMDFEMTTNDNGNMIILRKWLNSD